MRTKIFTVLLAFTIMVLNINIVLADNGFLCADDFEGYTSVVSGNGWTVRPGDMELSVPAVSTGEGKSAKIVSNRRSRIELINFFSATGDSVCGIDFKFSAYFSDRNAVRSLYLRKSPSAEARFLTFLKDSEQISIWSRTVPAELFTYKLNTWYDFHIRYNLKEGFLRIEIYDGENKVILQERERMQDAIEGISFVSFGTGDEDEAVSFVDDVYVYIADAASYFPDGMYLNDNFENNFSRGEISGYVLENKEAFGWEYTDFSKSGVINPGGSSAGMWKEIDYINGEKAFRLGFTINPKSFNGKTEIFIGKCKIFEIDFKNTILTLGDISGDIPVSNDWLEVRAEYIVDASLLNVTLQSGEKSQFLSDTINFEGTADKFGLLAKGDGKIYIDNIFLYPSAIEIPGKEAMAITKPDIKTGNLLSADFSNYEEGIPQGWAVVSQGYTLSPVSGGIKIENGGYTTELQHGMPGGKNTKCIEYNIELKVNDCNSNKALFIRDISAGDKSFLTFKTDKTVNVGSVSIPAFEFTYEVGKVYDISLALNMENGYIRVSFFDGEAFKILQGYRSETFSEINRISFVSFSASVRSSAVIYSVSVNAIDPIYPVQMDYSELGCENFSPYWAGSDLKGWSFKRDEGCTMSCAQGRYGTNVKITTVDGGSLKIFKNYDNVKTDNNFHIKFSAFFTDNVSERELLLNEINIISFHKGGLIKIGETDISSEKFFYSTNKWYNFEIYGSRMNKSLEVRVLSDTYKLTLKGDFEGAAENVRELSFGGSGEGSVHFDNFCFIPSGLCDIPSFDNEKSVNPNIGQIALLFTDDIISGNAYINGKKINDITFSGRNVILNVGSLEKLCDYKISYNDMKKENGESFCGNFAFKTGGGIEILSAGFKNPDNEQNNVQSGSMSAYVNYKSFEGEENILFSTAIFDKNSNKLLYIKTKSALAVESVKTTEMYFEIPKEHSELLVKLFITGNRIEPLAEVNLPSQYLRPDGESVLKLLRERYKEGEHPRILGDKNDFIRVRNLINTDKRVKKWYMELRVVADEYLYSKPIEYVKVNNTIEAPTYVREIIFTLGFMYQVTGDIKYAERVYAEMENAALYPDWNPYHYLDTATMMNAFAVGFDLIYDYISSDGERMNTILTAIEEFGFKTVLEDYKNTGGRERSYSWTVSSLPDNWNIICNSGAMIAALAFSDELPEYAGEIFSYGLQHIEKALDYFVPDGAWYEGVGYWGYFMRYLTNLLAAMDTSLGTDFGLSECEGFKETAYFPFAMTGSGGVFNFHNCAQGFNIGSEMYILAKILKDDNIAALYTKMLDDGKASAGVLGILYYSPAAADLKAELPIDNYFGNVEVCSMRSGGESSDIFVGVHAGQNNVSHGHLDIGEFVIDMLGERFACALGAENYSVTTDIPWGLYRKRAEGHNTLLINPDISPDQIPTARALIDRFESGDDEAFSVVNMTSAYSDKVKEAIRGVKLCEGRNAVVIRDEVAGKDKMDLWWFMHTAAEIELSADSKTAYLTLNGKIVKAEILDGDGQMFSVRDAAPMDERLNIPAQNKNEGIKKLCINVNDKKDVTITVAVTPLDYSLKNSVKPINEW